MINLSGDFSAVRFRREQIVSGISGRFSKFKKFARAMKMSLPQPVHLFSGTSLETESYAL